MIKTLILSAIGPAKLYIIGALVAAVLAGATGLYVKGRIDANHKHELALLEFELEQKTREIEIMQEALRADAERAAKDAENLEELETKIADLMEYVDDLEDADRECLDSDDTDRLHDLWS